MTPSKAAITAREFSAGGVVVRQREGQWWMIAIEPAGNRAHKSRKRVPEKTSAGKPVLALPKGIVDSGERPEETAAREVREETGVTAEVVKKLGDSRYVYVRTWGDGARVFKVVSFFLLRYKSGKLGDLPAETRHEIAKVMWIPLEEAPRMLTYKGDRDVARAAWEHVNTQPV